MAQKEYKKKYNSHPRKLLKFDVFHSEEVRETYRQIYQEWYIFSLHAAQMTAFRVDCSEKTALHAAVT